MLITVSSIPYSATDGLRCEARLAFPPSVLKGSRCEDCRSPASHEVPQGEYLVMVCWPCLQLIMRRRLGRRVGRKRGAVRHDIPTGWGQDTRWRRIEENRWHHAREAL